MPLLADALSDWRKQCGLITKQYDWFLPAGAIGVGDHIGGTSDLAQILFGRLHKELESAEMHRLATPFRHTYRRCWKRWVREFKVMQELLRHSTLAIHIGYLHPTITPAKHAAQAAVLSLVFSCEARATQTVVIRRS